VLVISAVVSLTAQNPILTPTDALAFDYPDADFTASQVTRFEAQWDGGAWGALPMTTFRDASTPAGFSSYKVIPPFSNGTHAVSYRACNSVGCGGGSVPFGFAFAVAETPKAVPGNVRKVPR
jgi:hypothetical protein